MSAFHHRGTEAQGRSAGAGTSASRGYGMGEINA
jgi:hypothetical protein